MTNYKLTWTEIHEVEVEEESIQEAINTFYTLKKEGALKDTMKQSFAPLIEEITENEVML